MRNTSDGVFGERRPMSDTRATGRKPSTCPAAPLTNMKNDAYWHYEMERVRCDQPTTREAVRLATRRYQRFKSQRFELLILITPLDAPAGGRSRPLPRPRNDLRKHS